MLYDYVLWLNWIVEEPQRVQKKKGKKVFGKKKFIIKKVQKKP